MIRFPLSLAALATLLFSAACGLKGPLYLPDERKDETAAPASASEASDTAPQSQKKDRATGTPGESSEPSVSPPDPDRPATPPRER
jgi:predicted small lipoprotein YifL